MMPPEKQLSPAEILRSIAPEAGEAWDTDRLYETLCKLLPMVTVADMLAMGPLLGEAIPEMKPLLGFDQRSPHHAYDLYTHVSHVVAGVPGEQNLRWAALLHDLGKVSTFTRDETGRGHFYGHAPAGAELADRVLRRLNAPADLRMQVTTLIGNHMTKLKPESLPQAVEALGYKNVEALLSLQEADMAGKGVGTPPEMQQFPRLRAALYEMREKNL